MTCNHEGDECPVHGSERFYDLPFADVILCLYGGVETVSGTPFNRADAVATVNRICDRLENSP